MDSDPAVESDVTAAPKLRTLVAKHPLFGDMMVMIPRARIRGWFVDRWLRELPFTPLRMVGRGGIRDDRIWLAIKERAEKRGEDPNETWRGVVGAAGEIAECLADLSVSIFERNLVASIEGSAPDAYDASIAAVKKELRSLRGKPLSWRGESLPAGEGRPGGSEAFNQFLEDVASRHRESARDEKNQRQVDRGREELEFWLSMVTEGDTNSP
jgi:hypothetical protein